MELPDLNSKQPPRKHIYIFFKKKKLCRYGAGMVQVQRYYNFNKLNIFWEQKIESVKTTTFKKANSQKCFIKIYFFSQTYNNSYMVNIFKTKHTASKS